MRAREEREFREFVAARMTALRRFAYLLCGDPHGADDVVSSENGHEVYVAQERFGSVAKALEQKFGEPRKASLVWRPQNTVAVDDEQGEKVLKLVDALNDNDDVQNVFANFEISDALVQKLTA